MRYLPVILFAVFSISTLTAKGQPKAETILTQNSLDTTTIKKMLQGDWQQKDDATFTLTITNDTIMEVSRGDNPGTDTFIFKVTQTNCSKDALNASLTGFYLNELNINNNKPLCGSIDFISDTKLKLSYGDQLMEFIRPQ